MRRIELTIAIGSALGLLTTIIADAAQQRMAVTPATPAAAVEEFAETPVLDPGYCVPFDQADASAGGTAAADIDCPAVRTAYDGSLG